jgi:hypothetical protein
MGDPIFTAFVGCKVEELANKTAERLKRALAINQVIAWRIMLMTLLGRETPELPAEVLFSDLEVKVLSAYAKKNSYCPHFPRRRSEADSKAWRIPGTFYTWDVLMTHRLVIS